MLRSSAALCLALMLFMPTPGHAQDKVMMQGFYWDVTPGGVWYDTLITRAPRLAWAGFDAVWLPPMSKGAASGYDVGYTPYDYYDLGTYDSCGGNSTGGQGQCLATRYGTQAGLAQAIAALKSRGVQVYADIVLNHRSGGSLEPNPYGASYTWSGGSLYGENGQTYTAFPLTHGSGRIAWPVGAGAEFFYPNASNNPGNTFDFYSESQLAGFHRMYTNTFAYDNALHNGVGANLPLGDSLMAWGDWLTTTLNLDGFRFDFVKGIHPEYLKRWVDHGAMRGKFHVHELYDGDIGRLKTYYGQLAGSAKPPAVFDFNLRFTYKGIFDNGEPIWKLQDAGLINQPGFSTEAIVTFVDNHDFDRINHAGQVAQSDHNPVVNNKMLAYAHMLTHPGYATVWWRDYFNYGLSAPIDQLLRIRKAFASGPYYALTRGSTGNPYWPSNNPSNPWESLYVGQRNGDAPGRGLIVAINKHPNQWAEVWVTQQNGAWTGKTLRDLTGNAGGGTTEVYGDGRVRLWAPPNSYTVWVPTDYTLAAAAPMPAPQQPTYQTANHVNLQWPASATVTEGTTETFYARLYAHGLTNAPGHYAGAQAWIGYNTTNTDPATWTNWVPAQFNGDRDLSDEYAAMLTLPAGTYYVASRFTVDGAPHRYGGYSAGGGGFWDGTRHTSSTLKVNAAVPNAHPGCSAPETSPSYAGGYVLNSTGTRAFVKVLVPMGGTRFEFYSTSNLTVDAPAADRDGTPLSSFTRQGDVFTFAPASPDSVFFPIRRADVGQSRVAFFLRVTDTCDREVDVDPSFTLAVDAASRQGFTLAAAQPSPTTGITTIGFGLGEAGPARLAVYDVLGREVARLVDDVRSSGTHQVRFDASALPSGVYVYRLEAAGRQITRTLTVTR